MNTKKRAMQNHKKTRGKSLSWYTNGLVPVQVQDLQHLISTGRCNPLPRMDPEPRDPWEY